LLLLLLLLLLLMLLLMLLLLLLFGVSLCGGFFDSYSDWQTYHDTVVWVGHIYRCNSKKKIEQKLSVISPCPYAFELQVGGR